MYATSQEEQLIRQAQAGDDKAIAEVISRNSRMLRARANQFGRRYGEEEDFYQEIVLRVLQALPSFKFTSTFATWLYTVATNECRHQANKRSKSAVAAYGLELDSPDAMIHVPAPDRYDPASEDADRLRFIRNELVPAVDKLPADMREVFIRVDLNGDSLEETSVALGCPVGTIKSRGYRARQRLAELLE